VAGYLVRGAGDRERLTRRELEAWQRAGDSLATARREGISLRAAARREGTTVRTVRKYFPGAVTRGGGRGWWRATEYDRAYRGRVPLTTRQGVLWLEVRDSRSRSLAARHAQAVTAYLLGDDPEGVALRSFRGRRIVGHLLVDDRDLDLIDELQRRDDFDWPDFYERV
jgi:hypothetical protein